MAKYAIITRLQNATLSSVSQKPEFGIFRPHLKIALKIVGLDFYICKAVCICITCVLTKYDHIKGKNICGIVSYCTQSL